MIRKLTWDEKEKSKGGHIDPGPFTIDWCDHYCEMYCGDQTGSDAKMDSANDEYRS